MVKKMCFGLCVLFLSHGAIANKYDIEAAENAKPGDVISFHDLQYKTTHFIRKYCRLETVVIVPSGQSMNVGVVCEKR